MRESWHRSDEIVLLRFGADGAVEILEQWPPGLPAVPGAGYAPHHRILPLPEPPPRERHVLDMR